MMGEIVLILDGGEEKTVRAGDYVVQRGVSHAWDNRTGYTCRMMVVMIAAEVVRLEDGRELAMRMSSSSEFGSRKRIRALDWTKRHSSNTTQSS